MHSNQFLLKLFLFTILWSSLSCASDKDNPLGLESNRLAYTLANGTERMYKGLCTLSQEGDKYKLSIKGAEKSDGIIFTVQRIKPFQTSTYSFSRDVNVVLNDKTGKELNIYVSSACKESDGILEIVHWNKKEQTITGHFKGPLCTRGIFAHLPGTEIKEGAFYNLKYNVK